MLFALAIAAAVQAATPVHKTFPNGGAVKTAWPEQNPLIGNIQAIKNMRAYCSRYDKTKDANERHNLAVAVRLARQNYQGDLTEDTYECWKTVE